MSYEILKQRYSEYRMRIKKLPAGSEEKRTQKQELSDFLESVRDAFGQEVVNQIVSKK